MPDFETHPIGAAAEPDLLQAERDDALSAAFAWKRMAWELRSYAVHDDDCKINRHGRLLDGRTWDQMPARAERGAQ